MFHTLADSLDANRKLVAAALLAVTAFAVFAAMQVQFDFSPQTVYRGQDDLVEFLESHKDKFGHEDATVVVVLQAEDTSRSVLDADALNWQANIAEAIQALPPVTEVRSLASLKYPRLQPGQGMVVTPLIRELPVEEDAAEIIRSRLSGMPLVEGTLFSESRLLAVTAVSLDPDYRAMSRLEDFFPVIEAFFESHPPPEGFRILLNGIPAIRLDIVRNLQADQALMFPLAGLLFLVVLFMMFRDLRITFIPLVAVLLGLVWTLALFVVFDLEFNILSNVVPTLLLILGAANCVHIVSRFGEELKLADTDTREARVKTLGEMGLTCLLTFGTTGIGFASLMLARSEALQTFALQTTLGFACEYMTIMPTMAVAFPCMVSPLQKRNAADSARIERSVNTIAASVCNQPYRVVAATAIAIAGGLLLASGLQVNSQMYEVYEDEHPTLQNIRLIERELAGVISMEVSLSTDDGKLLMTPQIVRRIHAFQASAATSAAVVFAQSYVDIHRAVYDGRGRGDEPEVTLPADDEELQRQLERSSALIERLGATAAYSSYMTPDGKNARLQFRVQDVGSFEFNKIIDRLESMLIDTFPPGAGISFRLTGDAYLHAKCIDGFVRDLVLSLLTASVIIFGVITLLFRSMRVGIISAIPNLTPLLLTLGYMRLRGYDLAIGNVIVFAIGLGIAVDDTIHFLARFREEKRNDTSTVDAILSTYKSTGHAIVLTTFLIVAGLSILLSSAFMPTRIFAELTAVTMCGALLGDLLLLPAALLLFWGNGQTRTTSNKELGLSQASP